MNRDRPTNPLLPRAAPAPQQEAPMETSAMLGAAVEARVGPQTPLRIPQDGGHRLPPWRVDTNPAVWVVGVHGGAGASTVTQLLGPGAAELERHLPVVPTGAPTPRVLLVARTHATGLARAADAAAQWATGRSGITLVGLAVVDDAPHLPKPTVTALRDLAGMVPALWHLPWCEAWRTTLSPTEVPRRTRKSLEAIRAAANAARTHPAAPAPGAAPLRPPPPAAAPQPPRTPAWTTRPATDH